ncbi:MAG: hypothetical protein JNL79_17285 [Myxococcales bacterium]|nr:hypothetical protein [Myxococcales bacterium]
MSRGLVALAVGAVAFGVGEARAETPYVFVVPGYQYSAGGNAPARAHGVDLTLHGFHPDLPVGLGVFGQLQRVGGDHNRYAGGVQVTFAIAGVEVGYAHVDGGKGPAVTNEVTGASTTAWSQTSGVQIAPFLSLGFFVFGLRWTLPVKQGPAPTWGAERAWTFSVKLPLQLSGRSMRDTLGQAWSAWK